jgi:nicotinamide mononucleotide transporter
MEGSLNLLIEIIATICGLIYIVLLMRENIWCWLFGIISSMLTIYLLLHVRLYAEAFLYVFYVVMGVYGWFLWNSKQSESDEYKITEWPLLKHALFIIGGALLSFGISQVFLAFTDAARTLVDSLTTVFALIATFMQAQKIKSNWLYWIGINAVSIFLYFDRGLSIYSFIFLIYMTLAIFAWLKWDRIVKSY